MNESYKAELLKCANLNRRDMPAEGYFTSKTYEPDGRTTVTYYTINDLNQEVSVPGMEDDLGVDINAKLTHGVWLKEWNKLDVDDRDFIALIVEHMDETNTERPDTLDCTPRKWLEIARKFTEKNLKDSLKECWRCYGTGKKVLTSRWGEISSCKCGSCGGTGVADYAVDAKLIAKLRKPMQIRKIQAWEEAKARG